MAEAEVGDDVYAEDPTVNALEAEIADRFGHAAALFVPTGTMGNQIALRLVCPAADEVICDADAHIVTYEHGGAAQHGGIQTRTIVADRGLLDPAVVEQQIRPDGYHLVPTRAVAVELSHNRGGGAVYPLQQLKELRSLCNDRGVLLHCDGARIFNAHVASAVTTSDYGALFDTLSVCLSKGLGAPAGSVVLMADGSLAEHARTLRKRLGGGMRQVGILAAAGRYALDHNVMRLADDHARAQRLAEALAELAPGGVAPDLVDTNIVAVDLAAAPVDAAEIAARCLADGVLVSVMGPRRIRLVTHLDIDDAGVERAIASLRQALG
jgi:threonine aldolase